MDNTTYIALSRAAGLRKNLDVIANNIANANTVGFKGDQMVFSEFVEHTMGLKNVDKQIAFTQDQLTYMDTSQGGLQSTGNPLDIAIQGSGWFGYQLPTGDLAFGRDGRLSVNALGNLVTTAGNAIVDDGGAPINIPLENVTSVNIAKDGVISDQNGNVLGNIGLFNLNNEQSLQRLGNGLLLNNENEALIPAFNSSIAQGFVEQSNVQNVVEMTRMMRVQNSYEQVNKLIKNAHELEKSVISRLGRPAN